MQRSMTKRLVFASLPTAIVVAMILAALNRAVGIPVSLTGSSLVLCDVAGGILLSISILTLFVGYIGAIIRVGQLQHWAWFGVLLGLLVLLSPIGIVALFVYCVSGPETMVPRAPVYLVYPPSPPTPTTLPPPDQKQ